MPPRRSAPTRHTGIEEKLQMLRRRMTPVEGGDRHLLFGADADLCVIVETGDEIDIEGCVRRGADLMGDGPKLFGRREAHADCPDPAPGADPEREVGSAAGKGHAGSSERMAAAEALRHTCRNATHLGSLCCLWTR
jgi:hypothetical protein